MASIMPVEEQKAAQEELLLESDRVLFLDRFDGVVEDACADARGSAEVYGVLGHYDTAINKIFEGDAKLDLKHVQLSPFKANGLSNDGKIFAMDLNEKHRLIFTTVSIEEGEVKRNFLLLLEHLEDHKYENSPFFKPGYLKAYVEQNQKALKAALQAVTPPPKEMESSLSFVRKEALQTKKPRYQSLHSSKSLHRLSLTQTEVLEHISGDRGGIHVINGPAGAGKSLLARRILERDVVETEGLPRRRLYLTKSRYLVKGMEQAFSETLPVNAVSCFTYEALCRQVAETDFGAQDFDFRSAFKDWSKARNKEANFQRVFDAFKRGTSKKGIHKKDTQLIEAEFLNCLYEEFRVCSGCQDVENYQKTEVRQTLFAKDPRLSKDIWQIFLAFKQQFAFVEASAVASDVPAQGKAKTKSARKKEAQSQAEANPRRCDLTFYEIACPSEAKQYDLIVVDESQLLSPQAIKNVLSWLKPNGRIVFCTDSLQCHEFRLSPLSQLTRVLDGQAAVLGKYQSYKLEEVYRNPPVIAALASDILRFRRSMIGGVVDKDECLVCRPSPEAEHEHRGKIHWMPSKPQEGKPDVENAKKLWEERFILENGLPSPEVAIVITDESFRKDAEALFKTEYGPCPNIFTAEEIGGLEYPYIIAYEPFYKCKGEYDPTFKETNDRIGKNDLEDTQNQVQDKYDKSTFGYTNAFAKLFTTATRTQKELSFVTDAPEHYCSHLKKAFLGCSEVAEAEVKVAVEAEAVKADAAAKPREDAKKPDPKAGAAELKEQAADLKARGFSKQAKATEEMLEKFEKKNLPLEEEVKEQHDQKQSSAKEKKFYQYAGNLLKCFTQKNLENLFERDAAFIGKVFSVEIEGMNFLSHIAKDEEKLKTLLEFLVQDVEGKICHAELLSDSLTGDLLLALTGNASSLYWLTCLRGGARFAYSSFK